MSRITREEVIHLAKLSRLELPDALIPTLQEDFEQVLGYIARLDEAVKKYDHQVMPHQVNVMRPDEAVMTDSRPLLAIAPAVEETYFVVPVIIRDRE